jgi:hypothetical protein
MPSASVSKARTGARDSLVTTALRLSTSLTSLGSGNLAGLAGFAVFEGTAGLFWDGLVLLNLVLGRDLP